jgi:hypothetical protein
MKREKDPPSVRIGKYCSNEGCRRVGVVAAKVSDFWVVKCGECERLPNITLDMSKIPSEVGRAGNHR